MSGRRADAKVFDMQGEEVPGISMRSASREFAVPLSTLHGWVAQGKVVVIARRSDGSGAPLYLDRRTVEAAAAAYRPGRLGRPARAQKLAS